MLYITVPRLKHLRLSIIKSGKKNWVEYPEIYIFLFPLNTSILQNISQEVELSEQYIQVWPCTFDCLKGGTANSKK